MTNNRSLLRDAQTLTEHLEAGAVGLFFIQAIRFLYSTLYAHLGSVDQWTKTLNQAGLSGVPGVVTTADVRPELIACGIALVLPLLAILLGRWRIGTLVAVITVAGRVYMTSSGSTAFGVIGAAVTAGSAALYLAILASRRPAIFPVMLTLGIAADQIIRLYGASIDLTWSDSFLNIQVIISIVVFILILLNLVLESIQIRRLRAEAAKDKHIELPAPLRMRITVGGTLGLGGLLFLEFTLLGLPNTAARRAGVTPEAIAPWLVFATLLPIVPAVRGLARQFFNIFDLRFRGWVYGLLIGCLLAIGFRFSGPVAAGALIIAQPLIGLGWWWLTQPTSKFGLFNGLAVTIGLLLFLGLTGLDYFTYDYAFVYGVPTPFSTILQNLHGFGLPIALFALLLLTLPSLFVRRPPWTGGRASGSLLALVISGLAAALAVTLSQPVVITPPSPGAPAIRVATLNLHGGYSLYFASDLPQIAAQVVTNGVDVLMVQEVETGRLVSGSVDQVDWLAHALHMQALYFPTNEGLQGLAVLTRLPILTERGVLLTSLAKQTGVQFVRVQTPDGTSLDIYNTELGFLLKNSTLSTDSQQQDQLNQLGEIFGLINQNTPNMSGRIAVGGTFNNVPDSDLYRHMAQVFSDPFAGQLDNKTMTWRLVNDLTSRVDYVWTRNITLRGAGVVPVPASTHNLVVVELAIGTPAGS